MEVVNARSALLSNCEVLSLLKELEADHLARTKTAVRIKKEEEASGFVSKIVPGEKHPSNVEVIHNLRTVEVEAIQYLSAPYLPTIRQTEDGVTKLTKDLGKYDLTKAEKLQIVNLAPTLPVELYVIVEELEDRLGEAMEDLLEDVKSSLNDLPITATVNGEDVHMNEISTRNGSSATWDTGDGDYGHDNEFDDRGEGAGVEGDLDIEDED